MAAGVGGLQTALILIGFSQYVTHVKNLVISHKRGKAKEIVKMSMVICDTDIISNG
jgi:hypothetical protein